MAEEREERRRWPRVVHNRVLLVATRERARVLDISMGGVLIVPQNQPPDVMVLRMALRGDPFAAELQVRHQTSAPGGEVRIGAAFVDMSAQSRGGLESFLRHATARKHQVQES